MEAIDKHLLWNFILYLKGTGFQLCIWSKDGDKKDFLHQRDI